MSAAPPSWTEFKGSFIRYDDLGISLDFSRMEPRDGFIKAKEPEWRSGLTAMQDLEAGGIANPDEGDKGRMVGHYWLRNAELPEQKLRTQIARDIAADIAAAKLLAARIHGGLLQPQRGGRFTHLLVIGIGGSALGPQLVADALVDPWKAPVRTHFMDNTDPNGIRRVLDEIGEALPRTLTVVVSKSGGTAETRNGMLAAADAYSRAGLDFSQHAVAVTGTAARGIESKLEARARAEDWLAIFPLNDWVGGRTSVMSMVGLVPAAIQGVDIDSFLAGAAAMDHRTRSAPPGDNISLMLALMWLSATGGTGAKDMVILPYKDRLALFSKYLQQLVMESLGKKLKLPNGKTVHHGIAVYGNKGSTDQHSYVQQLLDGVDNFFVTFIEVRESQGGAAIEVQPGITSGDYLQGFLRGTRAALTARKRENMTLSVPRVDAFYLGALIAAFERAVGFYASLVGINAYHQPAVEEGKKAAEDFLRYLRQVRSVLTDEGQTVNDIATKANVDVENTWHALAHMVANDPGVRRRAGESSKLEDDVFWVKSV